MLAVDEAILFYVAMAFFWLTVGAIAWLGGRIESHMRKHHPVHASRFFPVLMANFTRAPDEEKADLLRAQGRRRFRDFISSGGLKELADPHVDRILTLRRMMHWLCGVSALTVLLLSIRRFFQF